MPMTCEFLWWSAACRPAVHQMAVLLLKRMKWNLCFTFVDPKRMRG